MESAEAPELWRSKGIVLFWCLILQLWNTAGDSTLDKAILCFRRKPGGRPTVPETKILMNKCSTVWETAKIPARGGSLTSVLSLGRANSQHNLETNTNFFLLPTNRLVRPGDIQVAKTSLQQRIPLFNCYDILYTSK